MVPWYLEIQVHRCEEGGEKSQQIRELALLVTNSKADILSGQHESDCEKAF
jgi:hypothetical protein